MNHRVKSLIALISLFLLLVAGSALAAKPRPPQETVEKLLSAIRKIKDGDHLSSRQIEANRKYSDKAITFLDVREVSRKTLGKYWKIRTPKEQEAFVHLLSRLFKKVAFPNSAKFFADLKMVFGKNEIDEDEALVPLTVIHEDEGEINIDFKLRRHSGDWKVYDVILDDVSMRNNLRTQFYKVIAKNDYRELIRRMNKKLKKE